MGQIEFQSFRALWAPQIPGLPLGGSLTSMAQVGGVRIPLRQLLGLKLPKLAVP